MSDTLTLTIPPELATALRDAVSAGEYPSADAALADALGTWMRRHEDRAEELAWMRAKLRVSLSDPDPDLSIAEVKARLRQRRDALQPGSHEAA